MKGVPSMLGFSVFLNNIDATYMHNMTDAGFSDVFTSLQLPDVTEAHLARLGELCAVNHLRLTVDIHPALFEQFPIEKLQAFGVHQLRLDDGFSIEQMISLSTAFHIILNASTVTRKELEQLLINVPASRLAAWHNYYPHVSTGLSEEFFKQQNDLFKQYDIPVAAFIPGDEYRAPLFEGLPTLEKHRHFSPFASYLDIFEQVDLVLVGDYSLNDVSLKQFELFIQQQTILLHTSLERTYEDLHATRFHNRPDCAADVIRFLESRQTKRHVKPGVITTRPIGAVTIDNEQFGRYEGEVQLVKNPLASDARVNTIGYVTKADIPLLKLIGANQALQLEVIEWI